jgi:hypothetical protein
LTRFLPERGLPADVFSLFLHPITLFSQRILAKILSILAKIYRGKAFVAHRKR